MSACMKALTFDFNQKIKGQIFAVRFQEHLSDHWSLLSWNMGYLDGSAHINTHEHFQWVTYGGDAGGQGCPSCMGQWIWDQTGRRLL